ncbi:hypothetical protein CEP88_16145 [Roseobacter denitrificans]|uniref:BrnA antitoxin of type II toxin-antitoxin system n=1 Tax=Roseobacter denitrificans (strain ATCC 33942 / OCh 114) TaxID=375451 RepID=Q16AW0_ROSDO|nr:BrnA antitoxin family protein [Roseobacter denitrificans]ABG30883.1 hypothetical protein RD1_1235 [Roseobacter denitrificans OCh 114]AVL53979.1 hypothetical protein CEP88_16145 [Roseobacter denitrificans]SFG14746.1 BrnA antitoxin of type II toxin-antitoxin system [Roseobacter denitrificans OCh 114]
MPRLTKTEHIARRRLMYHLWRADEDTLPLRALREEVPDAWHMIEADIDCHEPKVKTTLYLDQSVAKMFRAMGQGYQARINRILNTWLAMKMAGLMEEETALGNRRARLIAAEQESGVRPGWGPGVREDF